MASFKVNSASEGRNSIKCGSIFSYKKNHCFYFDPIKIMGNMGKRLNLEHSFIIFFEFFRSSSN